MVRIHLKVVIYSEHECKNYIFALLFPIKIKGNVDFVKPALSSVFPEFTRLGCPEHDLIIFKCVSLHQKLMASVTQKPIHEMSQNFMFKLHPEINWRLLDFGGNFGTGGIVVSLLSDSFGSADVDFYYIR